MALCTERIEWPAPDGSTLVIEVNRVTREAARFARLLRIESLRELYPKPPREVAVRAA